ncbi:MAG TPA: hypothetical protein VFO19_06995 [Vicinamibacterales bacterium]|nr:hypothetical protein [Vicinamibacterales bacterium]
MRVWNIAVLAVAGAAAVANAPRISAESVIEHDAIDVPGARHTRPMAISPTGAISGVYVTNDSRTHGFLLDLNGLTTFDVPGSVFTSAQGINPQGDVVGLHSPGSMNFRGYLLRDGVFADIEIPGAINVRPFGINAAGDIVGGYVGTDNRSHGFLLRAGEITTYDVPNSTDTTLLDINARGDVVGRYQAPAGVFHMFILSSGGDFRSIDVPGALSTGGPGSRSGLSPFGVVAGTYRDSRVRGFLFNGSDYETIDFPDSQFTIASGVNPQGHVVGWYRDAAGFDRGFLIRR